MLRTIDICHTLIKEHVKDYDTVVDATCGNGYDTLFLASLVPNGKVFAYDIQYQAIANAKALTKDYQNITFYHKSHEEIEINNCSCVLFNLGYLPNSDKTILTNHITTLNAVKSLINQFIANPNLTIYIVVYPRHDEGRIESKMLDDFVQSLDAKKYLVNMIKPINQNYAPYLLTIEIKHKTDI